MALLTPAGTGRTPRAVLYCFRRPRGLVWFSRLAPRCLARRVSQGAASSPEEGSIGQGNQSGGEVELSDKLAAVELTKFMVGLRADRMTDQDIFALYRECLRVIGESDTAAPAETDPQKIAERFQAADTNHDEKLTPEEAKAGMPRVAARFPSYDA